MFKSLKILYSKYYNTTFYKQLKTNKRILNQNKI